MKPILGQLRFPLVFGLLLTLAFPVSALAIGSAFTLSGSDLVVDVDAKWVGCRDGGYYPIRARIRNIGPARKITLQYGSSNSTQKIPLVTRDLTLEQNATIFTTLLIPMVSEGTYGDLRILEGGRALKGLSQSIPLPDTAYQGNRSPQMLIVSSRLEDGRFFNEALQRKYLRPLFPHLHGQFGCRSTKHAPHAVDRLHRVGPAGHSAGHAGKGDQPRSAAGSARMGPFRWHTAGLSNRAERGRSR